MNTFFVFIVSLSVLIIMILTKIFQTKVREINFLSNLFSKGDARINDWIAQAIGKYSLYKKIANLFIFDFLPAYLYEVLVKMKDYVAKKYYFASDEFRGRRVLRDNGSVSFFLERLAEDKGDMSGRKA